MGRALGVGQALAALVPDLLYQETPSRLTCDVDDVTV
jgi:hypothetical protein